MHIDRDLPSSEREREREINYSSDEYPLEKDYANFRGIKKGMLRNLNSPGMLVTVDFAVRVRVTVKVTCLRECAAFSHAKNSRGNE